ncbi:TonB-dependent receptor [Sphingomonas sp. QA11]|uniref:TonB-dependent receptor domain-containing protein n=1 Tax=Sphingomonas sp. QA11 TaxID=2950605 RepID=UPI002349C221|nr:TonB-dependent receptor [Sphingomonas sp. QA11]WCM28482.1 TonB-dependent receptor [Sphingomonas sp. QA11]
MKNRLLTASALAGTLLFLSTRVEAQVAAKTSPDGAQDAPLVGSEAVEDTDTIVVTGSRIRRAEYDALEPTTVVSSQYLDVRGITNVADALNEQPGFGIPQNAEGGQSSYGVSQNFVNKFGLGTARTLTIVNGRRFVSTNAPTVLGNPAGLQVDLNVIPSLMVDRIENVSIGGAPVYGSDAIAGTVNVILKKKYEGVELQTLNGISDKGDNYRLNLSGIAGFKIGDGRGHVLIGGSYDRNDGLRAVDRERARQALTFQTNPSASTAGTQFPGRTPGNDGRINPDIPFNGGSSDGIPNTVLIGNTRIFSESTAGLILPTTSVNGISNGNVPGFGAGGLNRLQFDASGNIIPYTQGSPFGNTYGSGGDGFNLTDTRPLTNDLERYSANIVAEYEITPAVKAFFEGTYYHGIGREVIDQPVYNSPLFPGGANSALTFNINDPRLNAQARSILQGYGVTNFYLSRDFVDITNGAASSETDVYRGVFGLTGDIHALGKTFTYEASVNYGRTEGAFHQVLLDQQKFVNAINNCNPNPVVNAAPGGIRPIADSACVALNPFGPGRLDPGAVAYVNYFSTARSVLEQEVYNVNIGSSDVVTLWSGGVGFNLGYEHRREYGKFTPDPFQVAGRGRGAAIVGNQGSFDTDEVFGELLLPLVSRDNNVPLVDSLTLEGRGRYVDNSINGGFWTYTGGGRYRPIPDIEFRGNYTRSLRAPSIVELFTPQTNAGSFFPDPCDRANIGGGTNPTIRQRNCKAFFDAYGINPSTFDSIARTSAVPGVTGGNPTLKNEVADSYTFGVVLRPRFLPRFQAAIDWNRIKVTGNIASLTAANIAEGCYDNPNFNLGNPDAGNSFCTQFTRVHSSDANANGQIAANPANPGIRTGFVNGSFIEFKGLTATASYLIPLGGIGLGGRLSLDGTFFYLDTLRSSNNGVTVDPQAGEIGTPKYSGQFNVSYAGKGGIGISLQANYTGKAKYDMLFNADSRDILELDDQWLFNLALSQKIGDRATMRFTVTNLFDTAPPFPYDQLSAYDLLGRRYTVSMNVKF